MLDSGRHVLLVAVARVAGRELHRKVMEGSLQAHTELQ